MNKIFFTIVFLTAVCFYSLANNCFPLISPDEPRYAETAREMIESGNLITPHCDYQLRFDKPILFYWLESLSLKAFGLNEFAARLPSVFAGAGLIWLAFLLANLHGYAISASLILLTNFAMLVFSRLAVTDMLLNFFISASLVFFYLGYYRISFKKHQFALKTNLSSRWLISSFAMMGLAVLCKGPVGIVLPIIVILSFLTYEGHLKDFGEKSMKHLLIGVLVFLAITLPWYVSVHLATSGEFTKEFFLGHNLSRFTSVHTGHHAPFWFYLPVIMIGFFPWIFFLIPAIWSSSTIKNFSANSEPSLDARTIRFCIIWAITIFVFYSLSQTKLPTYILPIFLPLSIIVAKWWQDKFKTNKSQNNKNQDLLRATQCLLFIIIIFDILFFKFFSGLILNLDSKAFFLPIALISFLYIAASVIGTAGALFKARITFICIITASIISQIIFVTMMLVPFAKSRDAGSKAFTKRLSSNSVLYTYRIHPTRFSFYKRDEVIKLKDKSINHTLQQNSQQERYLVASKNDYQKLSKNSQLNLIEKNQVFAFYRIL